MTHPHPGVRGVGLVELMVALAIGLFIVLAGIALVLSQLREQHRRLAETRLRQEVRAVLAWVENDLRRAGGWGRPGAGLWAGTPTPAPLQNPYASVSPAGNDSAASLAYTYSRDTSENQTVDAAERFGLRLNTTAGAIEARIGDNWQAVTDPQAARFTGLAATSRTLALSLGDRCSLPCAAGSTDCPPRQLVRTLDVQVSAQAPTLPALQITHLRTVHLPIDASTGRCPS